MRHQLNPLHTYLISLVATTLALIVSSCTSTGSSQAIDTSDTLQIGIYDGWGGASTCKREAYHACLIDPAMSVRFVTSSDIASGVLDSLDAIVIPGGSGKGQYLDMGESNRTLLRDWVREGGTVFGICAGAYLLTDTPDYACLSMSGVEATDIEHDNRGHGICKVVLTDEGRGMLPELSHLDTLYMMYYEGPVLQDAQRTPISYTSLATMMSDVHLLNDAPAGMTIDRPFFTHTEYGAGHVLSSVGHPEATPGMQWIVPRLLRIALGATPIDYPGVVHPARYGRELLATAEVEERETQAYHTLLYGTPDAQASAIHYLDSIGSWDGKEMVRGHIYSSHDTVVLAAARYMSRGGYSAYLPDIEAKLSTMTDGTARQQMQAYRDSLAMYVRGTKWGSTEQ